MKYEQRSRAVNAMLGTASPPARPPPQPPATPPTGGAGRGLAGAGRGRGRGAVRQIVPGRGRGGGGQAATPPAPTWSPQDGGRTPGQGADGLPKLVKEVMPHPLWQSPPYDSCRMPPMCANGKFPCVLKYYLMQCGRCDKPQPTCMYRQQPREQDANILHETRESDPHYKEFEEALKNSGGSGQGFTTPPGGSPTRAQRAAQRSARRVGGSAALEERMETMANTLAELLNQAKVPAIRKVKKSPRTQASSSEESASEAESEVSSDESRSILTRPHHSHRHQ